MIHKPKALDCGENHRLALLINGLTESFLFYSELADLKAAILAALQGGSAAKKPNDKVGTITPSIESW